MRSTNWPLSLFLLVLAMGASSIAGTPGEAGFLSLRMPVGARETAMGGAGVASSQGAAAAYWNAARLAFEPLGTDLLLQHQRSFGLSDKESAVLAHRTANGVIGVLFSGWYSDDIERTSIDDVGVPLGTFAPSQVAVGVTYSRRLNDRLAVGVGVKLLHEEVDIDSSSGYAFDLFLSHKALIEGLWFGASYTNFGPDLTLRDTPYALPAVLRLGMAWDPQTDLFAGKFTLTGDMVFPNDGNEKAHVGAEYRLVPALALRLGTKVNYESQGYTWGVGFRKGEIEVGYAYEEMLNDFDPSHRFAVRFNFDGD